MKKLTVPLLASLLAATMILSMFPAQALAAPDIHTIVDELKANVQTDVSDLTNPGKDNEQSDHEAKSEDLIADILAALNNPVYSDTLAALQNGEPITQGAVSQTVSGLQQTLSDLGCDIAVDSSAGPGTFGTLNTLLTAFGLDETDKVDADVYTEILKLLLLSTDETAARDLLAEEFGTDEDPGKFEYMLGCSYYAQGRYYSAKEAFESSQYSDYEERAAACEQPFPQNGELKHNPNYQGSASLTIEVNSNDSTEGHYFVLCTEDLTFVSGLFITGSGKATTYFPGGIYKVLEFSGDTWYGDIENFGPDGYQEILIFDEYEDDSHKTWLGNEGGWIITVNVEGSTGASVGDEPFTGTIQYDS